LIGVQRPFGTVAPFFTRRRVTPFATEFGGRLAFGASAQSCTWLSQLPGVTHTRERSLPPLATVE
jgi:hypothetical protein